jgi:hypothetical protein
MNWDKSSSNTPGFEFDLEYYPDWWHPLRNNHLPLDSTQLVNKFRGVCWDTYPETTRLGWRGPLIPVSVLNALPDVWWGINPDKV